MIVVLSLHKSVDNAAVFVVLISFGMIAVAPLLRLSSSLLLWLLLFRLEHILLTCSDLIEIRESHFTAKSLRMLFKDISPEKMFNFLKEINIFGKI